MIENNDQMDMSNQDMSQNNSTPQSENWQPDENGVVQSDGASNTGNGAPSQKETQPAVNNQPPVAQVDQIVAALQKVMPAQQPQPQQPKWTQEDYDKAFKVVRPSEELVHKILEGGKTGMAALEEYTRQLSAHAEALAQFKAFEVEEKIKDMLEKRFGELEPTVRSLNENHMNQVSLGLQERYFKAHPEMEQYTPVLRAVKDQVLKECQAGTRPNFKNEQEAFSTITELARAALQQMGISVGSQTPNNGGQGQPAPRSRMTPTLVSASAGGGTSRGSGNSQIDLMHHVFGD